MLPLGGAVTFSTPLPAVYDNATSRWSMSNAWVGAPGRPGRQTRCWPHPVIEPGTRCRSRSDPG